MNEKIRLGILGGDYMRAATPVLCRLKCTLKRYSGNLKQDVYNLINVQIQQESGHLADGGGFWD